MYIHSKIKTVQKFILVENLYTNFTMKTSPIRAIIHKIYILETNSSGNNKKMTPIIIFCYSYHSHIILIHLAFHAYHFYSITVINNDKINKISSQLLHKLKCQNDQ
jgi:hypothetical protein